MSLSVRFDRGVSTSITLPEPGEGGGSVLAFSMAKAGSTLLFDILHDLAPQAGLAYFSPEDALWRVRRDIQPGLIDSAGVFQTRGYCYGGFRVFPTYPISILSEARAVLLVRDPKDMMVSNYFSNAFSHKPPSEDESSPAYQNFMKRRERIRNTDINDYVRTILGNYQKMLASYRGLWHRDTVLTFRYENVIQRKREWVEEIVQHYGWSLDAAAIDEVIERYDVFPDQEQPDSHVRQVSPGNYRNHLNDKTIGMVNAALVEDLQALGYPADG